jgi:hypothetical protein
MIFNFIEYDYGDQIKDDEVRVVCNTRGRSENKFCSKYLNGQTS